LRGHAGKGTWGQGGTSSGGGLARGHVGKGRGIQIDAEAARQRYREAKIQGREEAGRQNTEPKIQGGVGPSGI